MSPNNATKSPYQALKLPIKKYQIVATVAAVTAFLLGILIPTFAFAAGHWSCPFGSGVIRTGGFVLLMGVLSGLLIGNGAAFLVIFIAKWRQSSSASHRRKPE